MWWRRVAGVNLDDDAIKSADLRHKRVKVPTAPPRFRLSTADRPGIFSPDVRLYPRREDPSRHKRNRDSIGAKNRWFREVVHSNGHSFLRSYAHALCEAFGLRRQVGLQRRSGGRRPSHGGGLWDCLGSGVSPGARRQKRNSPVWNWISSGEPFDRGSVRSHG